MGKRKREKCVSCNVDIVTQNVTSSEVNKKDPETKLAELPLSQSPKKLATTI